jgi:hypothetical protein
MSIHECGRLAAMASSAFARVLFSTRLATLLVALSSFAGLLLAPSFAWAAPSIGTVQLTPTSIASGAATTVRVTAVIADPGVIPATVNLQRLNDAGAPVAVLGTLHDDGVNGDAVAGDQIYTLDAVFTETLPVRLRVSAGFKGLLRRLFSAEMLLNINRPPVARCRARPRRRRRYRRRRRRAPLHRSGRRPPGVSVDARGTAGRQRERTAGRRPGAAGVLRRPGRRLPAQAGRQRRQGRQRAGFRAHPRQCDQCPADRRSRSDQSVAAGSLVRLDGRGSRDPEGSPLTYAWELADKPASSIAVLDDPTSATPGFVADLAGVYVLRLVVSDGGASSVVDEIIVTAYAGNTPPTAMPGPDQSVAPGSRVALDGSASFDPDPGDGIAQYAWSFRRRAAGQYGGAVAADRRPFPVRR